MDPMLTSTDPSSIIDCSLLMTGIPTSTPISIGMVNNRTTNANPRINAKSIRKGKRRSTILLGILEDVSDGTSHSKPSVDPDTQQSPQEPDNPDSQSFDECYEPDDLSYYSQGNPIDYGNTDNQDDDYEAHLAYTDPVADKLIVSTCCQCGKEFISNNSLHKHLPTCPKDGSNLPSVASTIIALYAQIIKSDRGPNDNLLTKQGLKSWHCTTTYVRLNITEKYQEVCLDTGCLLIIINAEFARQIPDSDISNNDPITVSGIGSRHATSKCASFDIYIPGHLDSGSGDAFAKIRIRAYLVDDLRTNLLIGMDILGREGFVLDFDNHVGTIRACRDLCFPITVQPKPNRLQSTPVYTSHQAVIPGYSKGRLPVRIRAKLPTDRDFIFEPTDHPGLAIYAHLVDSDFSFVEAANESS
ncbi:hypothetical protein BDV23DRAFT_189695 [Aspergillus alliaceus]|uniref:Uncharacterized protein n=1 Tax=Petromyces alliaceus TaxID=209559 RepID=A0A5N7BQ55_PETAA|nr:hypothetical protein BDV23DRAFT_189695 [Aspergillus alliaceus]